MVDSRKNSALIEDSRKTSGSIINRRVRQKYPIKYIEMIQDTQNNSELIRLMKNSQSIIDKDDNLLKIQLIDCLLSEKHCELMADSRQKQ